jgi:hypothetical protein
MKSLRQIGLFAPNNPKATLEAKRKKANKDAIKAATPFMPKGRWWWSEGRSSPVPARRIRNKADRRAQKRSRGLAGRRTSIVRVAGSRSSRAEIVAAERGKGLAGRCVGSELPMGIVWVAAWSAAFIRNGFASSSLAQMGQYGAILFPDNPFPRARDEIVRARREVVTSMTWFSFYRRWTLFQFI